MRTGARDLLHPTAAVLASNSSQVGSEIAGGTMFLGT